MRLPHLIEHYILAYWSDKHLAVYYDAWRDFFLPGARNNWRGLAM